MPSKTTTTKKAKANDLSSSVTAASSPASLPLKGACENCRRLKIRCSGNEPCEQCIRRKKRGAICVFVPIRSRSKQTTKKGGEEGGESGKAAVATRTGAAAAAARTRMLEEHEIDDDDEEDERDEMSDEEEDELLSIGASECTGACGSPIEEESYLTDDPFEIAKSSNSESGSSSSSGFKNKSMVIVAEKMLADETTGRFLMDVFVRRIHPHTYVLSSTSPSNVFENLLNWTTKASDEIQRDAALAMACRMCGHEVLRNLLVKRMEATYERVKEEPLSHDTYSAVAIVANVLSTENMAKSLDIFQYLFAMHESLHPGVDPIASTCESLETLSINDNSNVNEKSRRPPVGIELADFYGCNESNGMYNDWASVTKAEISAHVQMATAQMMNWSQTLPEIELRSLIATFIRLTAIALPQGRPSQMVYFSLLVDLHLLDCILSPCITEIMHRRDPENRFGMSALFKRNAAAGMEETLEPCLLSEEITASLLRRVLVCRMLQFGSGLHMDAVSSFVAILQMIEVAIQWRSGNREKAAKIGEWIIGFIEHQDLNFWHPMISQNLLFLGSLFYEMRDVLGLMRIISVLDKLRRSQPSVEIGIAVLAELQARAARE